jgi:hypothetical protein
MKAGMLVTSMAWFISGRRGQQNLFSRKKRGVPRYISIIDRDVLREIDAIGVPTEIRDEVLSNLVFVPPGNRISWLRMIFYDL